MLIMGNNKERRRKEMNKDVICNPYLPSYEYVPDGEPHVFGDRLYIFGSHDRFDEKNIVKMIMCVGLHRHRI